MSTDSSGQDIFFEGRRVSLARSNGAENLLYSPDVLLNRPRWVSDDDAKCCSGCNAKFTPVKRRHHCRQCGHIFCNQCCKDKVLLKYFGHLDLERVCEKCKPLVKFLTVAFTPNVSVSEKLESAQGFHALCTDPKGIPTVLEVGGVPALVMLSKVRDAKVKSLVLDALHALAIDPVLLPYLAENRVPSVVCRTLDEPSVCSDHGLLTVCLSILMLFCKDAKHSHQVLESGAMKPLLLLSNGRSTPGHQMSDNKDKSLPLLALQTVDFLLGHPNICSTVLDDNERNPLPKIMPLVLSPEERIRELSLKILAAMSAVSDKHRRKIMQEDMYSGAPVCQILSSNPASEQVLINAVCLVGNLASAEFTQGGLSDHLACLFKLLTTHSSNSTLMSHVGRAIANMAQYRNHMDAIMRQLPALYRALVQSPKEDLRPLGILILLRMLKHSPGTTLDVVLNCGPREFLEAIIADHQALNAMQLAIVQHLPAIVLPS